MSSLSQSRDVRTQIFWCGRAVTATTRIHGRRMCIEWPLGIEVSCEIIRGGFFTDGQRNVTPTSWQYCSRLQQWRRDAVIDFFAAYNATVTRNAFQGRTTLKIAHSPGDLDPI